MNKKLLNNLTNAFTFLVILSLVASCTVVPKTSAISILNKMEDIDGKEFCDNFNRGYLSHSEKVGELKRILTKGFEYETSINDQIVKTFGYCQAHQWYVEETNSPTSRATYSLKFLETAHKWNLKARLAGAGSLSELYTAINLLEADIQLNSTNSFSGNSQAISSVNCLPTSMSTWANGNPSGWWNCFISFLGDSESLEYSIELSGGTWGGSTGFSYSDLNWFYNVPYKVSKAAKSGNLDDYIQ